MTSTLPTETTPPPAPRRSRTRRRVLWFVGGFLATVLLMPTIVGRFVLSGPRYTGPVSDHFNGTEFFYPEAPSAKKTMLDVWKWRLTSKRAKWTDRELVGPTDVPPERVDGEDRVRVSFVNHATVLLQFDGLNVLLDPIWSQRASPVDFAGPKRFKPVGIDFDDLPPIDVVMVSHNHYDHLDLAALRRLAERDSPRILLPLGVKALLDLAGIPGGEDMDWWQSADLAEGVRVTFTPSRHWSARGTSDRFATLWGGFAIEAPSGILYYSGDTGYAPFYKQVRERIGAPRLAILPIGAYLPRWFMKEHHQDPWEAIQAHKDLGAQTSLAVHWGTFPLADDAMDDPPNDLRKALAEAGMTEDEFWLLDNGQARELPLRDADQTTTGTEEPQLAEAVLE